MKCRLIITLTLFLSACYYQPQVQTTPNSQNTGKTDPQIDKNTKLTQPLSYTSQSYRNPKEKAFKGWQYLVEKLQKDGITQNEIRETFLNPKFPAAENIPFKLNPKEHPNIYKGFFTKNSLEKTRDFYQENISLLNAAQAQYQVPGSVISAILCVETSFGKNTGDQSVFYRLARIAYTSDPDNIIWNFKRLQREDSSVQFEEVRERAKYLDRTFYPELLALYDMKRRFNIPPLSLAGSSSGAFGYPQFLPSTFLKFAVDAHNRSTPSLYQLEDSVFSIANFLRHFGWNQNLPINVQRDVIWHYNKSDPYISAVLYLAENL